MEKKMTKKTTKKQRLFEKWPVVDAAEDAHIVITPHDVKTSKQKDPGHCAAALAGRREFHTEVRVHLSRTYVKDTKQRRWIRYITPEQISREIISFDRGAGFEPGEYELRAPVGSMRLGAYKQTGPKKTKGPKRAAIKKIARVRHSAKDSWSFEK